MHTRLLHHKAIAVADLVILAVKPQFVQAALLEAKAILDKQPLIVSIAAGTTIAELYQLFETTQPLRLVRVMPNMNALIGAGAAAVCGNAFASLKTSRLFYRCFEQLAKPGELEEQYFSILLLLQVALLRMLSYLLIRLPEQPLKWYEQRVGLRNCHTSCTRQRSNFGK